MNGLAIWKPEHPPAVSSSFPRAPFLPVGNPSPSGGKWAQKDLNYTVSGAQSRCGKLPGRRRLPGARSFTVYVHLTVVWHLSGAHLSEGQRLQGEGVKLSVLPRARSGDLGQRLSGAQSDCARDGSSSVCFPTLVSVSRGLGLFNELPGASGILEACSSHIPF